MTNETESVTDPGSKSVEAAVEPNADFAHCFLRLANLPNFALDRLSRYEATLWRQAGRILFALDASTLLRPGNAGGGKGPDFWRAFEVGEVRVIGDEPSNT